MVRYCAVPGCSSADTTLLSHRFPKKSSLAEKWQSSLDVGNIPVAELIVRYVVCTKHFEKTDYRNEESNYLNFTAVPKRTVANPKMNMEVTPKSIQIEPNRMKEITINSLEKNSNECASLTESDKDEEGVTYLIELESDLEEDTCEDAPMGDSSENFEEYEIEELKADLAEPAAEDTEQEENVDSVPSSELPTTPSEQNPATVNLDSQFLSLINLPKGVLVQQLIEAQKTIGLLKEKMELYQKAHKAIVESMEVFKK